MEGIRATCKEAKEEVVARGQDDLRKWTGPDLANLGYPGRARKLILYQGQRTWGPSNERIRRQSQGAALHSKYVDYKAIGFDVCKSPTD